METVRTDGCDVTAHDRYFAAPVVTCGMPVGRHNTICLAKRAIAEGIAGDFVECGVNAGGHPAVMAYVSDKYDGGRRKVHLFDSFEGLPMAGPDDTEFDKETLGMNPDRTHGKAGNRLIAERWQVELNMKRWHVNESLLVYHKGWLQDVLPIDTPSMGPIALLRVDVDLYDSTIPVFRYLYPLVPKGGYVISDDWGEAGATPARLAALKVLSEMGLPEPNWSRIPETIGTVWWKKE